MYCKYCGNEIKEGYKVCPNCGTPININTRKVEVITEKKNSNKLNVKCLIAFILGFAGMSNIACSIAAIVLGSIGLTEVKGDNNKNEKFAKTGLILGIVFTCIWGAYFILQIITIILEISLFVSFR